jgi:hypothetical protein
MAQGKSLRAIEMTDKKLLRYASTAELLVERDGHSFNPFCILAL